MVRSCLFNAIYNTNPYHKMKQINKHASRADQKKGRQLHCCDLTIFGKAAHWHQREIVSHTNQESAVNLTQRYLKRNAYLCNGM